LAKILLAAVLGTVYLIHATGLMRRLPAKPFRCEPCLAFWIAAGLSFAPGWAVDTIAVSFAAGVLAPLVSNLLRNLFNRTA
jgi:hypothetical protein